MNSATFAAFLQLNVINFSLFGLIHSRQINKKCLLEKYFMLHKKEKKMSGTLIK
jgi:hypothetical protein